MTIGERLLIFLVMFVTPVILVGVPVFAILVRRGRLVEKHLWKRYDGLDVHESRQAGDVNFVYHTYSGFFLWYAMHEHRVYTSPDEARMLLARLLRFNLTWGILTHPIIPIVAVANYYIQKWSIWNQERKLASTDDVRDKWPDDMMK